MRAHPKQPRGGGRRSGGSRAVPASRRIRAVLGATLGAALFTCCTGPGAQEPGSGDPARVPVAAERSMPSAPRGETAWLAAVDRAYDHVGGGMTAEQWLRRRMAHRRPGERPAVVMGVDDVMLRTHFEGIGALVPRSVRFVRVAHALGYPVFYVTGRSAATGLAQVESTLQRTQVPANAFYGRPVGAPSEAAAKAECRASILGQGYTLALDVGADEAGFDGIPLPEKEIRLPDFGLRR